MKWFFLKDSKPGIIQNLSALGIADLGTAVIGGVFWLVIATLIDPEEYGEINQNELPINEDTILRPVNPYAVTKIAQDFIAYVYFRSYGLKVIRTRAFNHEGPRRDKVFGLPMYAFQLAKIEEGLQKPIIKTGVLSDKRNLTHVKDMVEAYWLAVNKCKPGELYIIGNNQENLTFTYEQILN